MELAEDEIFQDFLVETYDSLDQYDQNLNLLCQAPESKDLIDSIFRTLHTIKGTSGFFQLNQLHQLTHVGEDLLALIRSGYRLYDENCNQTLCELGGVVRQILHNVEAKGDEGNEDHDKLIDQIKRLKAGEVIRPSLNSSASSGSTEKVAATQSVMDNSIRVNSDLLQKLDDFSDSLQTNVKELVVFTHNDASPLAQKLSGLQSLVGQLKETVNQATKESMAKHLKKFEQLAIEVAKQCNKKIQVTASGYDIVFYRSIISKIKDPLTHMIRNAVDHGIEDSSEREAKGKPTYGHIQIKVKPSHDGGLKINLIDDGKGLDGDKIKSKAIEKEVISEEKAAQLSEVEIYNLIFAPGFSTAEKVSAVSGRGVGMDVVRTNIENIGGSVTINSKLDKGTTFEIVIPRP